MLKTIDEKREFIVRTQRWLAYNVFGYSKKGTGSFVDAYEKILSRVYLDYGVKVGSEGYKNLDFLTEKEIDMMYHSTKNLSKMYNDIINQS